MLRAIVLGFGWTLQLLVPATGGQRGTDPRFFYAVEVDGGGRAARGLARQHGLEVISRVGGLEGVFTLRHSRGRPGRASLERRLASTAGVLWVQRQRGRHRDERGSITQLDPSQVHTSPGRRNVTDRQPELGRKGTDDSLLTFNDPLWPLQWELFAQGPYSSSSFDLNVMPVWSRNITGRGVVLSVVDDGVDYTNKDLRRNFEAYASFDLRSSHDPMPLRDEQNGHGTRCAGEIAMEANNSHCGVGVAFNARIGGIRLLGGPVTDAMEAAALTFNNHFIHIYVCSWGPRDDGAELGGPGVLTERALRLGTHQGRGGRGSIFVWAAGNGGLRGDHCGADGFVSSVHSVAVGAVTHTGKPAYFGEPCPGVMAVTPTGANLGGSLPLVTLSNLDDGCLTYFPGTSSAAPAAAGILALVLEANPELTWRDVQHLIATTAKIPDPAEPGWSINGAGYHVHHRYGFGVLDAGLMVQQAVRFSTGAPQRTCTRDAPLNTNRAVPRGGVASVSIQSEGCQGTDDEVNSLEHVQVRLNISSVCRGCLSIALESPASTASLLLDARPNDASAAGFRNWTLMTLHCWGEGPRGLWTLRVTDHCGTVKGCTRRQAEEAAGTLLSATLVLYGTYQPQGNTHEGLPRSLVSMGSRHLVPQTGDPPLDLIRWVYKLERDRKVSAADIPSPSRHKGAKEAPPPASWEDADGAKAPWKSPEGGVGENSAAASRVNCRTARLNRG